MKYEIVQPPFTLKFREMTKAELKAYFDWFIDEVPKRIDILQEAIRTTEGYEHWRADKSPESLGTLGKWFPKEVQTRRTSDAEKSGVAEGPGPVFEIPELELSNSTLSLAMDIGIYFAETLRSQYSHLKWEPTLKGGKKSVDFGQPVLEGFGGVPLNPVSIVITLAYAIADGTQGGDRLESLYGIWAAKAASQVQH